MLAPEPVTNNELFISTPLDPDTNRLPDITASPVNGNVDDAGKFVNCEPSPLNAPYEAVAVALPVKSPTGIVTSPDPDTLNNVSPDISATENTSSSKSSVTENN